MASEVTARVGHKRVTETGLHRPNVRVMKMLSFRCEECASEYAIIEVSARGGSRQKLCLHCGHPFPKPEGTPVLQYTLLKRPNQDTLEDL